MISTRGKYRFAAGNRTSMTRSSRLGLVSILLKLTVLAALFMGQ